MPLSTPHTPYRTPQLGELAGHQVGDAPRVGGELLGGGGVMRVVFEKETVGYRRNRAVILFDSVGVGIRPSVSY